MSIKTQLAVAVCHLFQWEVQLESAPIRATCIHTKPSGSLEDLSSGSKVQLDHQAAVETLQELSQTKTQTQC